MAEQLKRYLVRHPEMDIRCSKGGNIAYFTTEDPTAFEEKAGIFLEEKISVKHLELG